MFPSKKQASFNFVSAVTVCSDFGTQKSVSTFSPSFYHEEMGPDAMILGFLNIEF